MLSATKLSHNFGARNLFKNVNFQLYETEKIGLIGKNGVGKTTLFHILMDNQVSTEGSISKSTGYRVGMLAQFFEGDDDNTVRQEVHKVYQEYFSKKAELVALEKELEIKQDPEILNKLDELHSFFALYPINPDKEIEQSLKGLGFAEQDLDKPMSTFSGGWKMRVELAKLLLAKFDLILLDEPTNHLDIEAILWFEKYLQNYPGSYILISHDVSFLNNTTKKIFELSVQTLHIYAGNYHKYLSEKVERRAILEETVKNQQKKLETQQRLVDRFRAKASKAKFAKSLEKQIAKTEIVELEQDDIKAFSLKFPTVKRAGREIFNISNLSKSFGEKKVLSNINLVIERGETMAFIGQNGTGKSTLLKIITDQLEATSGEIKLGAEVNINYFAQDEADKLDVKKTVLETIGDFAEERFSTQLRSILGGFLFSGEDAEKKVSVLSGGEKTRLAIACMMVQDANVIIMDEPTNHLDIYSKEVLKKAITEYEGTVIVVSHDREFLKGLSTKTIEFKHGAIEEHLGDLEYVLEKRGVNFRELQINKSSASVKSGNENSSTKPKLSYEDRKKLQRAVSRHEKAIERIEARIVEINDLLMDPVVFKGDQGASLGKELSEQQEKLEQEMESWEKAVEVFEAAT